MLAFDRLGEGPPLLLLHGTTSSRQVWAPLIGDLAQQAEVLTVDLPGHGDSPLTSPTPPEWARDVASLLDSLGFDRVAVAGHSAGGWTALELAKLGRAEAVLALTPAGLWRKRSPLLTDMRLKANWRLGRLLGPRALGILRFPLVRSIGLRTASARPRQVPAEIAIAAARTAGATDSFPHHFSATRRLRFQGGQGIEVPVAVVWGDDDHIALAGKSRNLEELPPQTEVETWPGCGHMLMWDAPDRVASRIRELIQVEPAPT
jgi:pimeloyl-ACP methyl ester carboxylesterase